MNEVGKFLQEACETIARENPESIGIFILSKDGTSYNYYYKMDTTDKAVMAQRVFQDSMKDFIEVNADWLREVLEG